MVLAFQLPAATAVELAIYDVAGRAVRRLATGERFAAGAHVLRWDGRDQDGAISSPGLYFVRVRAGALAAEARLVRIR